MSVRLAEQIFGLVDFVGGVDGYQHRADLGSGPEGNIPLGHIGGPNSHVVAGAHAHSDQGPGKGVHIVPELGVCTGVIQSGVPESVLIRKLLHHAVKHLRKSQID